MKHFLKTTTTLLTLSALIACGEDATMEDSLNLSNRKNLERISITGQDFLTEGGTRSTVNINNEGVQFLWSANDTVGIFPNTGFQAPFAMDEGAGMQTATFNGGGWALKASSTYAAYYPFNFYNRDMTKIPVSYSGQAQEGNNSTAHIGSYDFMAASVTTPSNGAVTFDLKHMGCLVMLQTDLGEAKNLNFITLKAKVEAFTMSGFIDLTTNIPINMAATTTKTIPIPLKNFKVAANETCTIYFMMAPTNLLGENILITLLDEEGEYIRFNIEGKNFVAGTAYAYNLINGVKVNPSTPEYAVAVDLGLPSGTLWADRNVGADAPENYGEVFAWGETEPKNGWFTWETYKWCNGDKNSMTKYCSDSSYGTVDGKSTLDLEDDAAYVNMGTEWRMPTYEELVELRTECSWKYTSINGREGLKLTGPNGNSIFLPYTGYYYDGGHCNPSREGCYWSSSRLWNFQNYAHHFNFFQGGYSIQSPRYYGQSVRAVLRSE